MNANDKTMAPIGAQSLSLPFDPEDMLSVRVLPAEFSRMIGSSKQSVSRWIRDGKLTLGIDGRLNPNAAIKQLARNCDPGRFRQRLIKQAVSSMKDVIEQASQTGILEQQLAEANLEIARLNGTILRYDQAHEIAANQIALELDTIRRLPKHEGRVRKVAAMLRRAIEASAIDVVSS